MKLYHGSNIEVINPSLKYSRNSRDFGKGFYLTTDLEQAQTWAIKKTLINETGKPNISVFDFKKDQNIKIKKFNSPSIEWFDYVIKNRTDMHCFDDYDIVIGPIANDSTYEVINLYIRNILTKKEAISRLKTYKLKNQYAFKSEKALKSLKYMGVIK